MDLAAFDRQGTVAVTFDMSCYHTAVTLFLISQAVQLISLDGPQQPIRGPVHNGASLILAQTYFDNITILSKCSQNTVINLQVQMIDQSELELQILQLKLVEWGTEENRFMPEL